MLDLRFIRENPEVVKEAIRKKHVSFDLDLLLEKDVRLRELRVKIDDLRARRNQGSREISKLQGEEKKKAISDMQSVVCGLKEMEPEYDDLERQIGDELLQIPLPPADDVPEGETDENNVEISRWGTPQEFDFEPKDHVELCEMHDLLDVERGVKLAGSRSYILRNEGALLHWAVLRLALDHMLSEGFTPLTVPVLVREEFMVGTTYFPQGREQAYEIEKDELFLVGTAEVSLTSYYAGEMLNFEDLPKKLVSNSPCYRREAGTYGKDTRGIYRIHQFDKVEQVIVCENDPAISSEMHQFILANAEQVTQKLELPYRVMEVCTGDMGLGKYKMYDIECWMPSRNAYGETHSCSNLHDFQARRLNLRYRDAEGKPKFAHTLNNTVLASPRILIPLLENNQQADGSIRIPEALRPYMGGKEVLDPPHPNIP
ncbi:MAG TPA: serine--tRNA ligase [Candidatus Latescibacteria bacterium]|nr:serine--tRNA ligase [Candidatus Latescibacterota bacterium]